MESKVWGQVADPKAGVQATVEEKLLRRLGKYLRREPHFGNTAHIFPVFVTSRLSKFQGFPPRTLEFSLPSSEKFEHSPELRLIWKMSLETQVSSSLLIAQTSGGGKALKC